MKKHCIATLGLPVLALAMACGANNAGATTIKSNGLCHGDALQVGKHAPGRPAGIHGA